MTGSILQYERETFEEDEIDDTPHFFVENDILAAKNSEFINKANSNHIRQQNVRKNTLGVTSPNDLNRSSEHSPADSQNVQITKNEVFVEKAAPLTQEGIKAVCGTDEKYTEYVKTLNLKDKNTCNKLEEDACGLASGSKVRETLSSPVSYNIKELSK